MGPQICSIRVIIRRKGTEASGCKRKRNRKSTVRTDDFPKELSAYSDIEKKQVLGLLV